MGEIEVKDKLRLALTKELDNEYVVVYILSRIRKIIELEGVRNKYKLLNIFCNWSLHTKIDKTEDMKDILVEFVDNAETRHHLLSLDPFKEQFLTFIKNVLNIDLSINYLNTFVKILRDVISDTPISIRKSNIITITINPIELPRLENQITYKITTKKE